MRAFGHPARDKQKAYSPAHAALGPALHRGIQMDPDAAEIDLDPTIQSAAKAANPQHLHQLKAFFQSVGRIERKAAFSFNAPHRVGCWVSSFPSPPPVNRRARISSPRSRSEPPLARGTLLNGLHPSSCSHERRASPDRGGGRRRSG